MASVTAPTWASCLRRVCTLPFLPPPLPGPLLPLPLLIGGRARGWSSACMSARMAVISCRASSRLQPSELEISFQSLRSACNNSCVLTVRRPDSAESCCAQMSRTFLSNALSVARCAPPQSATALRKTCCVRASQAGLKCARSIDSSGVSSKSTALTSCASVRSVRAVRASIMSWYCLCDMRSCQGTHFMAPFGVNHWCTKLSKRMLGVLSLSKCSPG